MTGAAAATVAILAANQARERASACAELCDCGGATDMPAWAGALIFTLVACALVMLACIVVATLREEFGNAGTALVLAAMAAVFGAAWWALS